MAAIAQGMVTNNGTHMQVGPVFNPASLFASSEKGVWYDPSDINLDWRRNLLTRTQEFDNAAWTKYQSTITANATTAPDGTTTADLLAEDLNTDNHNVNGTNISVTAGAGYRASIYAKQAPSSTRHIQLRVAGQGTGIAWATFNLVTGAVGASGGSKLSSASIQDVGNGWFRCLLIGDLYATSNSTSGISAVLTQNATDTEIPSYTGDGTSGVYIWGAQLEEGSTATAYQPITDGVQDYLTYDSQPVLFQDTAGTTPVTSVEQPVGLMLDKSQGLVLGPELVTNGTFDTDSDWTKGTGWTISAGQATHASGTATSLDQTGVVTAGKWYKITIDATASGGTWALMFTGGTTTIVGSALSSGSYTLYGLAGASNTTLRIFAGAATTLSVDNVSVKELPGNHAVAANGSTARPVLRNRYNSLIYSEDFSNAAWDAGPDDFDISSNAILAPDGTTTADKIIVPNGSSLVNSGSGTYLSQQEISQSLSLSAGNYKYSVYGKIGEYPQYQLRVISTNSLGGGTSYAIAKFNLSDGSLAEAITGISSSSTSVGNGWYRLEVTFNVPSAATVYVGGWIWNGTNSATGNGSDGIYLWGAQLTTAADHDAINGEYQRIAAAPTVGAAPTYDDNPSKFPVYLYATTDDAMSTASIDFSSGDEMSVFAGVTKEQDAASGFLAEFSNVTGSNNGVFALLAPSSSGANSYRYVSKGTAEVSAGTGVFAAAPDTAVITGLSDISADITTLRRNGSLVETSTSDQGTGNFGNYPLYLFARNTTQFFYTGRLYSLIVRNALPTADELSGAETYVNSKTRAY